MNKDELRIVYMGTPDFAVEPLKRLVEGGYNIVGVVTMPDKPVGRHQTTLQASPVKLYAQEKGLPVMQPERLKSEEFLTELRNLRADLQIVVAFRMLPEVVWNMPRLGTFNLHASLLPQYRGAAPINWAIINGDRQTGVTTFFLEHEIDTGGIIRQVTTEIGENDNAGDIHDRLMEIGAQLVTDTVDDIMSGKASPIAQNAFSNSNDLRPAPKIFKETCQIDWSKGVKRCHDFIRGLSPYPAAWTELQNGDKTFILKIFKTEKEAGTPLEVSGEIVTDGKNSLKIALHDGYLIIKTLQLAGKKRMEVADFLRGFHFDANAKVK